MVPGVTDITRGGGGGGFGENEASAPGLRSRPWREGMLSTGKKRKIPKHPKYDTTGNIPLRSHSQVIDVYIAGADT